MAMESNFYFIQVKNKWLKQDKFENGEWSYTLVNGWVGRGTRYDSTQIHNMYHRGELKRIAKMFGVGKKNFRIVGFNYVFDDRDTLGENYTRLVFEKD